MTKTNRWCYFPLLFLGLLILLPILATVANSFMTSNEILRSFSDKLSVFDLLKEDFQKFLTLRFIPEKATLSQYKQILWENPTILKLLENSLKIALPITLGNLLVSVLTAYGFTLWNWKYKHILLFLYTLVMLLPIQATLVPNFLVAQLLGMEEGTLGIILPGIFSPFGVFLMYQGMKAVPTAYLESAMVDGASHLQILLYIVIPQVKSTIAALVILVFSDYWNVVEQAVVFITDYTKEPLSVFLSRLSTSQPHIVFATSCVFLLPPLWMLLVGQEDLEAGIELSGVK